MGWSWLGTRGKNVSFCNGWCLASSCLLLRMRTENGHGFVVVEYWLGGGGV